jgi:hypothetical protein
MQIKARHFALPVRQYAEEAVGNMGFGCGGDDVGEQGFWWHWRM